MPLTDNIEVWLPTIRAGSGADVFTSRLAEGLSGFGVDTFSTWFPHCFELLPAALRHITPPSRCNVVHANSWSGFAFARPAVPLVVTVHHCVHDEAFLPYRTTTQGIYHRLLIRRYEQRSLERADRVIAVSQFTADQVARCFKGTSPVVIHNGIDTDYLCPASHGHHENGRPFTVLYTGNLSFRKGADLLVNIMDLLGADFALEYTSGLRGGRLPERANIRFLGRLNAEELRAAYRACDAVLFPSRYEGFGYVPCEAMACGKPVVAADIGGVREVVEPGETGLLCPIDDSEAFARALRSLADDPAAAAQMGVAGRRRVVERFSLRSMAKSYLDVYRSL